MSGHVTGVVTGVGVQAHGVCGDEFALYPCVSLCVRYVLRTDDMT